LHAGRIRIARKKCHQRYRFIHSKGAGSILKHPAPILIAGLICIVLIAGCVSSPAGQPAAVSQANITAGTTGAQDISAIIPKFDAYAEQSFTKSGVPGMAVVVVKNDTVVYLRCFGVKNITTRAPVTPDTRFQLASISKSFTSASIASMVGNGELSWDDPVASLNPGFRLSDPWVSDHVTIRDLLSMRTGFPEYGADELQYTFGYNRSEILGRLRYLGLTGAFRSSYAYSNIGVTAAAEAASLKAGKPWEELVTERVFVPAGMHKTSARFSDFVNSADHADTYPTVNGTPVAGPFINDEVNGPAGGVSSTINDMARYARLQVNEGAIDGQQVINASALRETHTPQNLRTFTGTGLTAYALGWDTILENGHVRVEHGGDLDSGVSTCIVLYPEEQMSIVVLTNGFPGGHILKKALTFGWNDLYYTGTVQKDYYAMGEQQITEALKPGNPILDPFQHLPPAPEDALPARSFASYGGSFTQDYYGTVRIVPNATGLLVYPGHSTIPFFLAPYDGDTFRDTSSDTAVKFTLGGDRTAQSVWFTQFGTPGRNGTFVRISP
jgi:CubicO group peptidase (beta-lactamase class C family)